MNSTRTASRSQNVKPRHHLHPRSLNYYLKVAKARKKVGFLATKGFFQFREFLAREIVLPTTAEVSDSFAGVLSGPFSGAIPSEHWANGKGEREKTEKKDLKTIVKKSNEVLAEATTVFPFTLFPDTVTLDRKKLVVTQRTFFMTSKVLTIQIEEILNIAVNVGPFFGALHIAIRGLTSEDHFDVSYLWRRDAVHLKHMIEGYIIALKDKIDTEHLPKDEAIKVLAELGHDSNPERT